ncbi:hypothetical protein L798_07081 [Zootermopsis nevadensis]|uniref:Uncharacterized protein n=1 Tax=Zootermopsis nevadensis TaxID=136037 RepID=A0A067R8F8_ZOONE|nr:hypothetical protein L798_07081 [Zootermopsis nevadensis]
MGMHGQWLKRIGKCRFPNSFSIKQLALQSARWHLEPQEPGSVHNQEEIVRKSNAVRSMRSPNFLSDARIWNACNGDLYIRKHWRLTLTTANVLSNSRITQLEKISVVELCNITSLQDSFYFVTRPNLREIG